MGSIRVRGKNKLVLGALIRTFNLAAHFLKTKITLKDLMCFDVVHV